MTTIEIITAYILFLTFLAVVYYARETQKLRKTTERQTNLTLQPFLSFVYEERDNKFKLMNYGKTPALDIEFSEISLIDGKELKMKYLISKVDYLPPGAMIDVDIKLKDGEKIRDTDSFGRGALDPKSARRPFEVKITYKNAVNDKFTVKGKLGTETFIFDKIKKIS